MQKAELVGIKLGHLCLSTALSLSLTKSFDPDIKDEYIASKTVLCITVVVSPGYRMYQQIKLQFEIL